MSTSKIITEIIENNIRQHVETGEQNTLSATSAQFTTAKIQGCTNVSSNSSRSEGIQDGAPRAGMADTQG